MAEPRYKQIAQSFRAQRTRLTRPLRLADELTLATEHQVARDTIRRALKLLETEKAVVRRPSRGTYLQPPATAATNMRGKVIGNL